MDMLVLYSKNYSKISCPLECFRCSMDSIAVLYISYTIDGCVVYDSKNNDEYDL